MKRRLFTKLTRDSKQQDYSHRWGRRRSFIRINSLPDAPLPASAGAGTVGPCCRDLRPFGPCRNRKMGDEDFEGGPMPRVLAALRPHFFSQLPGAEKHFALASPPVPGLWTIANPVSPRPRVRRSRATHCHCLGPSLPVPLTRGGNYLPRPVCTTCHHSRPRFPFPNRHSNFVSTLLRVDSPACVNRHSYS
jgi:hypothetical protein